jgi:hypothetical protein
MAAPACGRRGGGCVERAEYGCESDIVNRGRKTYLLRWRRCTQRQRMPATSPPLIIEVFAPERFVRDRGTREDPGRCIQRAPAALDVRPVGSLLVTIRRADFDRQRLVARQIHGLIGDNHPTIKVRADLLDMRCSWTNPIRERETDGLWRDYRSSSAATTLIEPSTATTSASMCPSVSLAMTW